MPPRAGEKQPRIVFEDGGRQRVDPDPGVARQLGAVVAEQPVDLVPFLGAAVCVQRLGNRRELLEHAPRGTVADAQRMLSAFADQHVLQVRPQDLVVAVVAAIADCAGEHLATLQLLEQPLAVVAVQEPVADGAVETAQNTGVEQKRAEESGQLVEDVPRQVLADEPRPTTEAPEDAPALVEGLAGGGEVEKLQAGRPTFGAPGQLGELDRRKGLLVEVPEKVLHLPRPEAEVVACDLRQRA